MSVRTARRGPNAGGQFWGCSRFPGCRGTRDIDNGQGEATDQDADASTSSIDDIPHSRVEWADRLPGDEWERIYTVGGGGLRSIDLFSASEAVLGPPGRGRLTQTFMAVRGTTSPIGGVSEDLRQVSGTYRKILQRGDRPPMDPDSERRLVRIAGVPHVVDSQDPGDLSFELDPLLAAMPSSAALASAVGWSHGEFAAPDARIFDSEEEALLVEWVRSEVGDAAARWLYPQASFDALVGESVNVTGRRVDLLFSAPWSDPLVIEVDGEQHGQAEQVDAARDEALRRAGLDVHRIPASEIRAGSGPALSRLVAALQPPDLTLDANAMRLVHGPPFVTRLGLAIGEALERGWLTPAGTWSIAVRDPLGVLHVAVQGLIELLGAVDELWAGYFAPERCVFNFGDRVVELTRTGAASYREATAGSAESPDLEIIGEPHRSPMDALPEPRIGKTIVLRSASLPVELAATGSEGRRLAVARDEQAMGDALLRVLRFVFAKKEFREGQEDSLQQVLRRKDCVVLLPTGAGKSLIYQLAGLLLPGRTLVIDPLVALMEDQVRSLRRFGIDRAIPISSFTTQQGQSDAALDRVRSGDALFCLVAPERLQQRSFRDALQSLTVGVPINLVVVDEAHCISEWGHDFRPSYLNLGPSVRRLCADASGDTPPLLALTGTASRAVLRDVLAELDVDRTDPGALIKPTSFNRPELSFDVVSAEPANAEARLAGLLDSLPDRLGIPSQELFQPGGRRHLGIVFCPHVNGRFGVVNVARRIRETVTPHVGIYSGSAPNGFDHRAWEHLKRETADAFANGDLAILCSTKAFGMGVDIPTVRYTVHFGLPGSIEAYYQEAGRAGRDRLAAQCELVFTELDRGLTGRLLSDDADGDAARRLFESRPAGARDDILNQLWFHFGTFGGRDAEVAGVTSVIEMLGWTGSALTVQLPFGAENGKPRGRSLVRLEQVGVVRDYLKEWSGKRFEVHCAERDTAGLDEAFLTTAGRALPGRVETLRAEIAALPASSPRDRARELAERMVNLTYDTIERSRRRALREMRNLAADSRSDREIRQRIEDYFREGDLAPRLQPLVEAQVVRVEDWVDVYEELTPADAGELRGTTARFLESYPDHPGLLVGRALAELMVHEQVREFRDDLDRALDYGRARYGVEWDDLAAFVPLLLQRARVSASGWAPLVWTIWDERSGPAEPLVQTEDGALVADNAPAGELVVVLERRSRRHAAAARSLADSLIR